MAHLVFNGDTLIEFSYIDGKLKAITYNVLEEMDVYPRDPDGLEYYYTIFEMV